MNSSRLPSWCQHAIQPSANEDQSYASSPAHCLGAGSVNLKIVPSGTLAAAHNRPPCASMIERQIDTPMSKRPGLVV